MTVAEYCRNKTRALQLCAILDHGWIVETVWIDYEDIFRISDRSRNMTVKETEQDKLTIVDANGKKMEIPCLFIYAE